MMFLLIIFIYLIGIGIGILLLMAFTYLGVLLFDAIKDEIDDINKRGK